MHPTHIPTKLTAFSDVWSPKVVAMFLLLLTTATGCNDNGNLSQFASDWLNKNSSRTACIDVIPSEFDDRPAVENLVRVQWFGCEIGTPNDSYTLGEYGSFRTISNEYGHIASVPLYTHEEWANRQLGDFSLLLPFWPTEHQDIVSVELEVAATNYERWIRSVLSQSSVAFQEAAKADDASIVYRGGVKSLWGTLSRGCDIYNIGDFTVIVSKGYEPAEGDPKTMHVDFLDESTVHRLVIESETWQNAELLAKYAIAGYGYAPE